MIQMHDISPRTVTVRTVAVRTVAAACLAALLQAGQLSAQGELRSQRDSTSYVLGHTIAGIALRNSATDAYRFAERFRLHTESFTDGILDAASLPIGQLDDELDSLSRMTGPTAASMERLNYLLGRFEASAYVSTLHVGPHDLDRASVAAGVADAAEKRCRFDSATCHGLIRIMLARGRAPLPASVARRSDSLHRAYHANANAALEYVAANAKHPGVVTLANGVQYETVRAGHGRRFMPGEEAIVRYRVLLTDGTVLADERNHDAHSSRSLAFRDVRLLETLRLMPTGSRWRIVLPPTADPKDFNATYGALVKAPYGGALVYEVELVRFEKES